MFYLYYCKSNDTPKIPSIVSIKSKTSSISSYEFDQGCIFFDEKSFNNVEQNSDKLVLIDLFNAEYELDQASSFNNIDSLRETRILISNSRVKIKSDLFGSRPIYQYIDDQLIIFASSMDLIEASVDKKLTIDPVLTILECFSIKTSDKTSIKEIVRVPPSTEVTINGGKLEETDLFDLAFITPDKVMKAPYWESLAYDRLRNILYKSCENDKHHFVSLTAGYDSRLTFSLLPNKMGVSVKTWGDQTNADVIISQKLADIRALPFNNKNNSELMANLDENLINQLFKENLYSHNEIRHTFIMAALLKNWQSKTGNCLEFNSLGGELARSIYYGKCQTENDSDFYKQNNVYNLIDQLQSLKFFNKAFASKLKRRLSNNNVIPDTLTDPRVREDYFNLRFRFGRGWSVRYRSTQVCGSTLYPLMDPIFLYFCYKIPPELRQGSLLFKRMIYSADKSLLDVDFNPHKKIPLLSKIMKRLNLKNAPVNYTYEQTLSRTVEQNLDKITNNLSELYRTKESDVYFSHLFGSNIRDAISIQKLQNIVMPNPLFRINSTMQNLEKKFKDGII